MNIKSLEGEVWVDVKNYEGLYKISNYGRLFAPQKTVKCRNYKTRVLPEKLLHIRIGRDGYPAHSLSKEGVHKNFRIHTLVATAFVENPNKEKYNAVHHIDKNRTNNVYTNLMWCDLQKNGFYRYLDNKKTKNIEHTIKKEVVYKDNIPNIDMSSEELWKAIPGWEGLYEVSTKGRIKSLKRTTHREDERCGKVEVVLKEKFLKLQKRYQRHGDFYLGIRLYRDGVWSSYKIHHLVALTYIPNPNKLPQANHKNGDKACNCIENLEWTDNSRNQKHAYRIGLHQPIKGEECGTSKLVAEQVLEIRRLYETGDYSLRVLGEMFKCDFTNIALIIKRKNWKHI